MKKTLGLLSVAVLLTACTTLYTATVSITQVVDAGMKDWAQMSVAGKSSVAIDNAVIKAHNQYREACNVAQTALIAYKASGDSSQYVAALSAVRAAADGIFTIITPLLSPDESATLKANLQKASSI